MFYIPELLSGKGQWAVIWLAATYPDRLNKRVLIQTNIGGLALEVAEPTIPLSLRLSAILMRGVVVIYDRQVKYLLNDTNDIYRKLNSVFSKEDKQAPTRARTTVR